jgi:putative hydrolase of the HAD superfamily
MLTISECVGRFDVLLFDLMDTLMFGGNRFSATEDYASTYHQLGGTYLTDEAVQQVIHQTWCQMTAHYNDPAYHTDFPPADHYLAQTLHALALPVADLPRLHDVFARHELGHVPDRHCATLHQLAKTHRLGLVSNLWARKPLFVNKLKHCGIHNLFEALVFSSDHNIVKPSSGLFTLALEAMNVPAHRVLFIGDSLERDIRGAQALGMTAVLVTGNEPVPTDYKGHHIPDVGTLMVG